MFYNIICSKNYVGFCVIVYVWYGKGLFVCDVEIFKCLFKMDKDQWMYDNIMFKQVYMNEQNEDETGVNEEHVDCSDAFNTSRMEKDQWMHDNIMFKQVDMNEQNEDETGVNEEHVDCSDAFNTSRVFATRDDVLHWARSVAYEIGFVMEWSYRSRKKYFIRRDTGSRKCGCSFKLHGKPLVGGQGRMVKLMCGSHNHEMAKSLVGYSYIGRLTKDEKTIIADMTKSMAKTRNILLTLKENNDQYIHWHRLKDEDVVRDIFWCHPDAVKLCNACNLIFLKESTYKTNRYRISLLDFVGVTPTGMTFSTSFAYLEGECVNNVAWTLEQFRGLFLRCDALPRVIVTNGDLALINAVKTIFPECTNLLCMFHIDKNVKTKRKSLIGKKNTQDYFMDAWGNLVYCPFEHQFNDGLKKVDSA
ncbi:Protein FAR1-RELATED SEQUENCE 6 [Glycine max]|nr:Protein FAR1-RELATED SEQUENCE 6 [Glycine max]